MRGKGVLMGILSFLIVISVVSASNLITPLPIVVKVIPSENIVEYERYEVRITNLRTNETITGYTNEYLEFSVDWANSEKGYEIGDVFEIVALNQSTRIKYTGEPPTELVNAYTGEDVSIVYFYMDKVCESFCIKEKVIYIPSECPEDTTPYAECNSCCEPCLECICPPCPEVECPEDTTPYERCDSCCPDCPETIPMEMLVTLILTFFGIGFGSGTYGYKFVIRRRKDSGKLEAQITQHKHYGINRYHSIYTIHRDERIRHPKGCRNPIYKDGRFVKCGDRR